MSIKDLIEKILGVSGAGEFLQNNSDVIKRICVIAAVVIFAGAMVISHTPRREEVKLVDDIEISEETVQDKVFADIDGEVKNPMVVELDDGSRVEDAIEAAGGLTDDADITGINRAAFITDGDKIHIPSKEELAGTGLSAQAERSLAQYTDSGKVNINLADSEELQTLTGIGPVTAEKIIEYRENSGRFTKPEELKNVSGIGDKTYEKLKDSIIT